MFATDGSEKDPVVVYKDFAEKKPEQTCERIVSLLFRSKQLEIKVTWNQKLVQSKWWNIQNQQFDENHGSKSRTWKQQAPKPQR